MHSTALHLVSTKQINKISDRHINCIPNSGRKNPTSNSDLQQKQRTNLETESSTLVGSDENKEVLEV